MEFDAADYMSGLSKLNLPERQRVVAETVKNLDTNEKKSTIVDAANQLSETDKKEVTERINAVLTQPDERTNNLIWILIIASFTIVFIGTVSSMIYSLLSDHAAAFDKLLIIFTTVVGFLVGLLSPSPIKR